MNMKTEFMGHMYENTFFRYFYFMLNYEVFSLYTPVLYSF